MRRTHLIGLLALVALAIASPAHAHIIAAGSAGGVQGFAHPFSGLDHILAMVAVGVWAAQTGRRALWVLPVAFPLAMAVGGLLGVAGLPAPGIEAGIAASVLGLGLLIAFQAKPPLAISAALVALFALFHGHAHGTELPLAASPVAYAAGFVLATSLIHVAGVFTGRLIRGIGEGRVLRLAGGAIAASGLVLLVTV